MISKIEVTIEVIIHATEDINKFFDSFLDIFGIESSEFSQTQLVGHYDNPIIMLKTKISKKQAQQFIRIINERISKTQMDELIDYFEERLSDSGLYLRLDKQEFVKGKITIREQDAIKIKIFTPVFNKKELVKTYLKLFTESN